MIKLGLKLLLNYVTNSYYLLVTLYLLVLAYGIVTGRWL